MHLHLTDGIAADDRHAADARHAAVAAGCRSCWLLQLVVLAACCWLAVRLATRPLQAAGAAADALGPDLKAARLPEDGPSEVARAARAFNAMQDRIATYMTERMQILAAISHDLQTPITRMRLRVDMMDDDAQGAKLQQDLQEMESLVKEGVDLCAHAARRDRVAAPRRSGCAVRQPGLRLSSMPGRRCRFTARIGTPLMTRPQALRRIVGNLVDNALKFGGERGDRSGARARTAP